MPRSVPHAMLQYIYQSNGYADSLLSNEGWDENWEDHGNFTTFNQREFYPDTLDWTGGDFVNRENGKVFIPT